MTRTTTALAAAAIFALLATSPAAAQRTPRNRNAARQNAAKRDASKRDATKRDASKRDVLERPYGEGPLTFDDFAAKTPEGATGGAMLMADLRYNHTYRGARRGPELVVQLTGIEIFAMVLRYKSWMYDRQNEPALAYPQGHFDIDQLLALKCQRFLMQKLAAGAVYSGVGKNEQEAVGNMEQNFQKALGEFVVERAQLHRRYDQTTGNGADREAIARQRKEIGKQIEELEAELKKMGAGAKSTPRRRRR